MGLGFIGWIVVGILAGWLAEKFMKRDHGLITNLVVGVLGALIGGFLATRLFGINADGSWIVATLIAFVGACILLFLLGLFKRR